MAGVTFTRDSAIRIRDVVRKVEGTQTPPLRNRPRGGGGDFHRILMCKSNEAAAQGETKTCEIYDGDEQTSFTATGQTIEVYYRFGAASNNVWVAVAETARGYEALQCGT